MNHNKQYLIYFCLFIFLFIGLSYSQKLFNIEQKSEKLYLENKTIEEVFELYWTSSFIGNVDTVKQLSTLPPNGFLQSCVGNDETLEKKPSVANETSSLERVVASEDNLKSSNTKIDGLKGSFRGENVPSDVYYTSEYIYVSRIPFKKVKILEKRIYEDEAFLEFITADYKGVFEENAQREIVFLKREKQVWKIFSIGDKKRIFAIEDEVNYAISRPQCENIK